MVAPAEIAQVNEITLIAHKDGVTVLKVSVYGCVLVGDIGYETLKLGFLDGIEERVFPEKPEVSLLYVLELRGIHMGCMQLQAHSGKLTGKLSYLLGLITGCAGIGLLACYASETYAVTAIAGCHVISRLRCGYAHLIYLTGQRYLIQRLLYNAGTIKLEHDRRVSLMVETLSVGTSAEEFIIIKIYLNSIHSAE